MSATSKYEMVRRSVHQHGEVRARRIRQLLEQVDPDAHLLRVECLGDTVRIEGDADHLDRVLRGVVG